MENAEQYGFQARRDQPSGTPKAAPPKPIDLSPDGVRAVAEGVVPLPEGFWGSYSRDMVLLREAVRAIWQEEQRQEARRSTIESASYRVVQDARAGRLGSVEVFVKHDGRGQPYATHVRFPSHREPMTIEAALDARLIR